ncbi:regulator of chromosome condensation 1/beta-lactamase-inhibitor protein II [Radiomyces spectabilis]|uniref:regulator of chromosome condensation 1/beta-lactamase-inhibitor protein II n=1 Tax=Radiomyces spectabilis TaxID=64574 RepID=UPI00221FFDE2|nr:regulator of chromosome condensation 1/beta-lactamase-inhibitor protein II [Radiomyces spectabilis]KAI8377547.1 regulator of chromosome condensation 1/beta-lactamase-inhibitor protein II [Radiomyces spectabilis]
MWGKAVICGNFAWDEIAKKNKPDENQLLLTPHLIRELVDVRVKHVVTSPVACHSVIISEDGDVWVFGRNGRGQLGLGHHNSVDYPVRVKSTFESHIEIGDRKIVAAAVGRNHTLLVSESGEVFGTGDNRLGQLTFAGDGYKSFKRLTSLNKEKIVQVACGAEFTLVLNDQGKVFAFGSQEYGQLGNGADGQFIKSAGTLATRPQERPLLVKALIERNIVSIACGANHSLAMDDGGYVYSWGFGGYGRLGHGEQKDLFAPQVISKLAGPGRATRASAIACGSSCSMALDGTNQLLMWGKWKNTGDGSSGQPWMSPKYLYDLNGWSFLTMAAGARSLFAVADTEPTTVAWGQVANSELGYGDEAPARSSTRPQKVEPLEGIVTLGVSAGVGHTLFLVKPDNELVQDLPKWPATETDDFCVKCRKDDNEDKILLCDKCDASTHTYCAVPPLQEIPEGDWYCDKCHPPQEETPKPAPPRKGQVATGDKVPSKRQKTK